MILNGSFSGCIHVFWFCFFVLSRYLCNFQLYFMDYIFCAFSLLLISLFCTTVIDCISFIVMTEFPFPIEFFHYNNFSTLPSFLIFFLLHSLLQQMLLSIERSIYWTSSFNYLNVYFLSWSLFTEFVTEALNRLHSPIYLNTTLVHESLLKPRFCILYLTFHYLQNTQNQLLDMS